MTELYRPFTRTGAPIMVMDCASAELCKYAANAMLATRISFMNEIANVCERFGADVDKVRQAIASDRRIGPAFLFPGVGYGGSCFPKDVKAIVKFSADKKYRFRILEAVEAVNEQQKLRLLDEARQALRQKSLKGKTIAVWGLAFKPRTDDMREAPAIPIIEGLLKRGAKVRAFDPEAQGDVARAHLRASASTTRSTPTTRSTGADALLVVTEWNEFREPDFEKMKRLMKQPVIFDGRNIYDPAADSRASASPTPRSAGHEHGRRHGRRRLRRQPRRQSAGGRRLRRRRLRRPVGRARRGGRADRRARFRPERSRWSRATCSTARRWARVLAIDGRHGRHAFRRGGAALAVLQLRVTYCSSAGNQRSIICATDCDLPASVDSITWKERWSSLRRRRRPQAQRRPDL